MQVVWNTSGCLLERIVGIVQPKLVRHWAIGLQYFEPDYAQAICPIFVSQYYILHLCFIACVCGGLLGIGTLCMNVANMTRTNRNSHDK